VLSEPFGQLDRGRGWSCLSVDQQRDRTTVDRARGERATDRQLDDLRRMVAAEQQHVDDLPGGLRGTQALLELLPELIEALRPAALLALLAERERVLQRPRLVSEQLEVVIQSRGAQLAAAQPRMRRDRPAVGEHLDLPGPDPGGDLRPDQAHRHRVVVATHHDHRLLVDAVR